jgi:serine/threonine protein kinase
VAPEVLKNEPYGSAVDMWSIGVILYILLCGFPPFYHESTTQLYKQIKKGEYDFPAPYWTEVSEEAKDLVRKLLCVDPAKRLTAQQVLQHPWICGSAARTKQFSADHTRRLLMMQARRRLRKGVQTIIAINKFSDVLTLMANDELRMDQIQSATAEAQSASSPSDSATSSMRSK